MSKIVEKNLLENGQGYLMSQIALTYADAKILLKLVELELMVQRKDGKQNNYKQVQALKRDLTMSCSRLKKAFQARQDGRFKKKETERWE